MLKDGLKLAHLIGLVILLCTSCGTEPGSEEANLEEYALNRGGKVYYFSFAVGYSGDSYQMKQNATYWSNQIAVALQWRAQQSGSWGGKYVVNSGSGNYSSLANGLNWLKNNAGTNDTAVVYIHTHGHSGGMAGPGMSWSDFADRCLDVPASNLFVYINTCHSRYGVDALMNDNRFWATWRNIGAFSSVGYGETSAASNWNGSYFTYTPLARVLHDNAWYSRNTYQLLGTDDDTRWWWCQSFAGCHHPYEYVRANIPYRKVW